jgi:hypothetical protein
MAKKKKSPGRPKKPAGQRRETDIRIPVTAAEKRAIQQAAQQQAENGELAGWARTVLLAAAGGKLQ